MRAPDLKYKLVKQRVGCASYKFAQRSLGGYIYIYNIYNVYILGLKDMLHKSTTNFPVFLIGKKLNFHLRKGILGLEKSG